MINLSLGLPCSWVQSEYQQLILQAQEVAQLAINARESSDVAAKRLEAVRYPSCPHTCGGHPC